MTVSDVGSKEYAVFVCVTALSLAGQYHAERTIVKISDDRAVHFTISLFVTVVPDHASSVRRKGKVDGKSAHFVAVQISEVAQAPIAHTIQAVALFLCV